MAFFEFILETFRWLVNFQPTIENAAQLMIALIGVSAIALTQSPDPRLSRWASVLGLIGQPAWFYSAMVTKNYGIFLICFLYTWAWGKGFWRNFGPFIKESLKGLRRKNKPVFVDQVFKLSDVINFTFQKSLPGGFEIRREGSRFYSQSLYIPVSIENREFKIFATDIDHACSSHQAVTVAAKTFLYKAVIDAIQEFQGNLDTTERIVPPSIKEKDLLPGDTFSRVVNITEPLIHGGGVIDIFDKTVTVYLRR